MRNYRGFFSDIMLNIIGNMIVLGFIQLIVFPYVSSNVGGKEFGVIITVYGIINVYISSFGNSLNNVRLLDEEGVESNYNYLLLIICILLIPVIFLLQLVYHIETWTSLGLLLFSLLSTIRFFSLVYFRVIINYKKMMYSNLLLVCGYILGVFGVKLGLPWPVIFVTGESLSVIYIYITTGALKDGIDRTSNFKKVARDFSQLSFSSLLLNVFNYLDRFLILPIIGSKEVAVYYIASTIPKILLLLVTPVTNVLLTYINRVTKSKKKIFNLSIIFCFVLLIVGYAFTVLISPLILKVLYPNFLKDTLYLVPIVTLGVMLSIISSVLNPFILKYCDMKYQTIIALTYGIVYIVISVIFSFKFGLYGFAVATVVANLLKCILLIFLGNRKILD